MDTIAFPKLGLTFNVDPVAFTIGDYSIKWYGLIIACGLLLALVYGMRVAKKFNVTVDDLSDIVIFSVIFGVIGARLYYCLFYVDGLGINPYFEDPVSMLYIWNGGLGIYGGIIASFLTAFIICKIKKISVGAIFDIGALGFLIGQSIGRWGNFVNQEAYGSATNLPWGMVIANETSAVHPCFLYESLWCALGFLLLHIYSKRRKFNGEVFLMYIAWYAFGRFFIEGLRTDSLMLGNLKISQLVAGIFFVTAIALIIVKRVQAKKDAVENTGSYESLFDETAKAVEMETAEAAEKYDIDEDEDEAEKTAETDTEVAEDKSTQETTEDTAEEKTDSSEE